MSQKSVTHVIADSGAFIRNAPLQSIAENIYTIPEVVKEIKDKATLQRLQVLPYNIEYRVPSQESIKFVSQFAMKTGDYKSLSAVDLKVMALTYQLEKEFVGSDHIKSAPERKIEWNSTTKSLEKPTEIAGFYLSAGKDKPKSESISDSTSQSSNPVENLTEEAYHTEKRNSESCDLVNDIRESCDTHTNSDTLVTNQTGNRTENITVTIEDPNIIYENKQPEQKSDNLESSNQFHTEGEIIQESMLRADSDEEEDEMSDESDSDDEDDGWITPNNIKDIKQKMGNLPTEEADVMVGCLTMDFAIQNVLIQMGLNVISVDGMLIKRAKSYVLRCFSCMKITTNVLKEFCPFCGNNTLQKVSMTVEEDGSICYYLSRRKRISAKGLKYALPMPKGGKHANNPILCEDQPVPQQRATKKSQQKFDVFNPDYIAGYSPFAVTDITSRAAQLGIRSGRTEHFNKRNPNERKKYGRRK